MQVEYKWMRAVENQTRRLEIVLIKNRIHIHVFLFTKSLVFKTLSIFI